MVFSTVIMLRSAASLVAAAVVLTAHAAERSPAANVRPEAIRSHVEFLASDLLEGRAAATRGYDIAAAYVAAQFRQFGLIPGGDTETFFQTVPLLEATPVLPGSAAELVLDKDTHAFEYGTHYLPSADFLSASSTLSAPLVFVGYGIDAPELQYDDFQNIDIKGRIAVLFTGAPARFPNNQRAYYSSTLTKWTTLTERGAVGAIMIDSIVDAKRVPWERSVAMSWTPQMRWLDQQGEPQNAFPQLKLRFRFNHEAAPRLFESSLTSFEDALAAADAGAPQSFELPGMLTLTATTGLRRTESVNVLGVLPGSDPHLKQEFIVLTAHLDHLGRGSAVGGDSVYNGAHDNAVGVAILLEVARALQASGAKPRRSLVFAAVTAEEKGLLGSDVLAHRARDEGREIVAALNIDMPLPLAPVQDLVALGAEHSSLGTLARTAVTSLGYRLSDDATPEQVSFIRSDQFSFVRQGIPAILLKSGNTPRDRDLDLEAMRRQYREVNYHQPSDDLALPIDYATAADLARANLRIMLDAANAPAAPRWQSGDFFAEKFSRAR
jgi:Peptidase family M28